MNTFLDILRDIVSAKLFIFISGFISGVLACWHFCPAYWEWRTHRLDVECKNKEERKAAALRRLESRKARAEEQERIYKENVKFLVDSINKVMQDFSEKIDGRMKALEAKEKLVKELAQLLQDSVVKVERKLENREIMEEFVISPMFDAIREKIKELGEW